MIRIGNFAKGLGMRGLVGFAVAVVVVVWGCDRTGTTQTPSDRGFVDGGGFFNDDPGADIPALPPLIPDAIEETETESFFRARAIDPASEDSAGPKFVVTGDIDNDGLPDLATAWNQSQVVQVHLQRRDADDNITFESVQIAGTTPIAIIAGIKLADMDNDGNLDIVVLVKHQSFLSVCPGNGMPNEAGFTGVVLILYSPGVGLENGANWAETEILASLELNADGSIPPGTPSDSAKDIPENGGKTALDVGDITGDGLPDIVITSNRLPPPCDFSESDVELYINPGAGQARDGTVWEQVTIDRDVPELKDVVISDVDGDGDLDIIFTRPTAASQNLAWRSNPLTDGGIAAVRQGTAAWTNRPIGQIDGGADLVTIGDVDRDGFDDVIVRSNGGSLVEWFKHPGPDDPLNVTNVTPTRLNLPWSVFVLIDFVSRQPLGITLGDINFDGQVEILLGSEGSVFWLDSSTAATVFDPWTANLIVDDAQADDSLFEAEGPAFINELLVLDLDCDGANDIVATIDRRSLSGLSNDVVVWFRNVLLPEDVGLDTPLVPGCP